MENTKKKTNPFLAILKNIGSRVWLIVTFVIIALLVAVSCVATSDILSGVLDMVLGGDRAVLDPNFTTRFVADDNANTKASALENSNNVNVELCEEGMILLKNKNNTALPLTKNSKVSVFGHNANDIVISGSGSAGASSDGVKTLYDSLDSAGFTLNPTLKDFYSSSAAGSVRTANPAMDGGVSTLEIGETPQANYTDTVKNSYADYNDAAIIVISRIGGEGWDLPRAQVDDSSRTFLELDKTEEDMITAVTGAGFKKVIVLINAANQMECNFIQQNDKIDAALWIGFPGAQGIMAVGSILNGDVNPSGHLTDTYVKDLNSAPAMANFGDNGVDGGDQFMVDGKAKLYCFVDYEEGIYVGYRYYETRGLTDGEDWYNNNVIYPFGYGLSYTSFDWDVDTSIDGTQISKGNTIDVKVKVKNTGSVTGKDVIQVYASAPYTAGQIEKADKVLVGFVKTDALEPNEEKEYTIAVDPYDFASYDYNDANNNGFSGYELDQGAYKLYIGETAHDSTNVINMNLSSNIQWSTNPTTGEAVDNKFDYADDHLQSQLSRNDWEGTWPVSPTVEDRTMEKDELEEKLKASAKLTDYPADELAKLTTMPTMGKAGDLTIFDMFGLDFNDPQWDDLLDQCTAEEMLNLLRNGGFNTQAMDSISKPKTVDCDGPVGLTNFMGDPTVYDTCKFAGEVVTGSTWNIDLMEKMGRAVGNEGLAGNVKGDGRNYTGWYAPGFNIHRTAFGGRSCEYFSEDPFLSGMMGAYEVKGANSKGMTTYLKHFVGNEQETHRDTNGDCTFVDEQALREIYLKPFEKAVKIGKTRGIMSSFNRLGFRWTGSTYNLITGVLRNEWGFHGAVITDFNTHQSAYMCCKPMFYAGGNLDLVSQPAAGSEYADVNNAAEMNLLRNATHETLYAVANSNAELIIGYTMSYWRLMILIVDIVIPVGLLAWGFFAIRKALKATDVEVKVTQDGETKAE